MSIQFPGDSQQLIKGCREVAVDDDIVEVVTVVILHALTAADHLLQFVVSEAARTVLIERRTSVGGAARFLKNVHWRRFDVNYVRLELARS